MSVSRPLRPPKRVFSLRVRVTALLIIAVVLPLLITGFGSELILRPTLLSQAAVEMGNDAQSHAQSVDALFIARLQDVGFLGQFLAIQKYLAGNELFQQQATSELALGYHLDPNYSNWTLFDPAGNVRLSYPAAPQPRGKYMMPPELVPYLQGKNKNVISDVYFDDTTHTAFIDVYASITAPSGTLLGFERATLLLNDLWTWVNNETNAVPGSYAMVLDGHGVRIAYTNTDTTLTTLPSALFKSIGPIPADFQQRITDENLYGNSRGHAGMLSDPTLVTLQQNTQGTTVFQGTPALQQSPFQMYRAASHIVPWTYVVLRPINTITSAANQQDMYLLLIAAFVTILAALVGLVVSAGITRPILRSVTSLLKSSQTLQTLAANEQTMSTEQKWIVESSQLGLDSVQYYARATHVAARKLDDIGGEIVRRWERLDPQEAKHHLGEIITTAHYIEKAASHQEKSSEHLFTALRINTQVTKQLISGATSATEAANQLEEVVRQLRQVVGE